MFRATRNRGHNLLEAVLAAVIFATVAVALLGIWGMQFSALSKSRSMLVASFLVERTMEECLAAGFERVEDLFPQPPVPSLVTIRSRTRSGETIQQFQVEVLVNAHPTDPLRKTIVVTVRFTDKTGDRTVTYHCAVHRDS